MTKTAKSKTDSATPILAPEQLVVIKANGKREIFEADKLRESLLNSGASPKAAEEVVIRIKGELHNDITTDEIYKNAFNILRDIEGASARKYSLRRAILELGPSGFPFEKFIAEILKAKGLETRTGEIVLGSCVPHEMDVVAWNSKKLMMIEAKFHNELGTKSDLKVALYIKARFDDIKENVFNYGGVDRPVTDFWLVTNTKFSSTAIHYGECKNLTMIGWNYPEKGNLKDLIEEETLHPITCLTSLSGAQKKALLASHVVLSSNILDNPNVLTELFGPKFDPQPVMSEINEL